MRTRARWILPLLLAALLGWLLWPQADEPAGPLDARDPEHGAPGSLTAAADKAEAPGLETRKTAALPREGEIELQHCVVTVRGPFPAEPRVGIPVRVHDPRANRSTIHITDDAGRIRLSDIPLDGSVEVSALASWRHGAKVLASTQVTAKAHELLCTEGLMLGVVFRDALSGQPVRDVRWTPSADRAVIPPTSDAEVRIPLLPGNEAYGVGLEFPHPVVGRHVAWDASEWHVRIARRATRLRAEYPLRRHARVHVKALEHDGTLARKAAIAGFTFAGRCITDGFRAVPDRGGFAVQGIPFFRERPVEVLVTRPGAVAKDDTLNADAVEVEEEDGLVPSDGSCFERELTDAALAEGRLPAAWETLCILTARFPQDPRSTLFWGFEGNSIDFDFTRRFGVGRPMEEGTVEVQVLDARGYPIPGALVWCWIVGQRTDFLGRARWTDVPIKIREIRLEEPGFVRTVQTVKVESGKVTRVTLREAAGGTVRVRVVDKDGDALPYAMVALPEKAGWIDIDAAGVQRIDPFTDVQGRRTLRRVPAGTWKLRAHWGGLDGHAEVKVVDGKTQTVTVTLKE